MHFNKHYLRNDYEPVFDKAYGQTRGRTGRESPKMLKQ